MSVHFLLDSHDESRWLRKWDILQNTLWTQNKRMKETFVCVWITAMIKGMNILSYHFKNSFFFQELRQNLDSPSHSLNLLDDIYFCLQHSEFKNFQKSISINIICLLAIIIYAHKGMIFRFFHVFFIDPWLCKLARLGRNITNCIVIEEIHETPWHVKPCSVDSHNESSLHAFFHGSCQVAHGFTHASLWNWHTISRNAIKEKNLIFVVMHQKQAVRIRLLNSKHFKHSSNCEQGNRGGCPTSSMHMIFLWNISVSDCLTLCGILVIEPQN